jgi:hypothetical protein
MYNSTMANFNTPEIMEARALYRAHLERQKVYPWNRPEDAEARALYRAHMERQKAAVMEQLNPIVVDYYYVPEIFREVTEDEAYEMYWTARDAAREEERERDERATSIARELAYEFELEQQGLR